MLSNVDVNEESSARLSDWQIKLWWYNHEPLYIYFFGILWTDPSMNLSNSKIINLCVIIIMEVIRNRDSRQFN